MSQDLFVEPCYIRATHPYHFRSGEWAEAVGVKMALRRACYLVLFNDGKTDLWPIEDPMAAYEFSYKRPAPLSEQQGERDGQQQKPVLSGRVV